MDWAVAFTMWDRFGPVLLGSSRSEVLKQWGPPKAKGPLLETDDGGSLQVWKYPAQGLEMTLYSDKPKLAGATLFALRAKPPATLETRLGIRVGSTEAELEAAYGRFRGVDGSMSAEGRLAFGVAWTWLIFETKDGKVSAIRWGNGEQFIEPE